jgi:glycosyltransferase involved in cell wall biosynthesis
VRKGSQPVGPQRLAYLLNGFPCLAETYILQEILELERQGLSPRIFALYEPSDAQLVEEAQSVQVPVTYIPRPGYFSRDMLLLLTAAVRRFFKAPWRFLRAGVLVAVRARQLSAARHLLYAAYLADQLEHESITHLHAHFANTPGSIAQLVHLLTGMAYSFTAHAYDIYLPSKAALAYKIQLATFVVTCTAYNQHYLAALVDQRVGERIHRIYHGLNFRAFPSSPAVPSISLTSPRMLAVSRLVEKKGLPYLLRACRLLIDQGYDFTCCIVGEGPLRPALEHEIRALALADRVELRGAQPHERVIELYQQATLMTLPCIVGQDGDRDGIPNVLVESLYMGVPIVSTTVSGIPELITSEVNGLLVPSNDSVTLAAALGRLLDDPSLRDRLATAGRQTVLEQFDMRQNVTHLIDLLYPHWQQTHQRLEAEIGSLSHPNTSTVENRA